MGELDGRVAVVTGGGRGIGRAVALELAARGAAVAALARSADEVAAVAEEIRAAGGRAIGLACDVGDRAAVEGALAEIARQLGQATIVVNNAAVVGPLGLTAEVDMDEWERAIEINLIGAFSVARLALPAMIAQGWGRIINVSSGAAMGTGLVRGSAYSVSKAGMEMLTRALSAELAGSGVAAISVRPGVVDTAMQAHIRATPEELIGETTSRRFHGYHDEGQLLDPARPARLIASLCGSEGIKHSGEAISIYDELGQRLSHS